MCSYCDAWFCAEHGCLHFRPAWDGKKRRSIDTYANVIAFFALIGMIAAAAWFMVGPPHGESDLGTILIHAFILFVVFVLWGALSEIRKKK